MTDFDQPNMTLVDEIVSTYETCAQRLKAIVIEPPGKSASSREWNQARASVLLTQVQGEIDRLKKTATNWTGNALSNSIQKGVKVADRQAEQAGVRPGGNSPLKGSFHAVDRDAVELLAKDTVGDLHKAADSMGRVATDTLRRMAATGVSNADVNRILSGGIIEGKPDQAIRELREKLKAVHGEKVIIQGKAGPIAFDTGYYANMVAVTKTREAVCKARHGRLAERGIDLVVVVGRVSKNFCTAYLDKVFSISGKNKKYPALDELPGGGPPFHPNCSKSTAPFIAALADPEELAAAQRDPELDAMLKTKNTTDLQRKFESLQGKQLATARASTMRTAAGRKMLTGAEDDPHYQEHLVKQLGVGHVDLAARPDIGEAVVKAVQQTVAAGGALPKSIEVSSAPFVRLGILDAHRVATTSPDGRITLNPAWRGWENLDKAVASLHAQNIISSDDPRHVVFHELAHVDDAAHGVPFESKRFTSIADQSIAAKVSFRATHSQGEFLAEVRAARLSGIRFGKDVMDLYERLRRP